MLLMMMRGRGPLLLISCLMKLLLRKKLKNDKRKKTVMFGISMSSSPSRGTEIYRKRGRRLLYLVFICTLSCSLKTVIYRYAHVCVLVEIHQTFIYWFLFGFPVCAGCKVNLLKLCF